MPRIPIPTYQQQSSTPLSTPMAQAPMVAVQDNTGEALGQVGSSLGQLAVATQAVQNEQGRAWASRIASDARVQFNDRANALKASAKPNGAGYRDNLLKEYDAYTGQAYADAPDNAKPFLKEAFHRLRNDIYMGAGNWQVDRGYKYTINQYDQSINSAATAVLMDPTSYDEVRPQLMAALNASILEPGAKQGLIKKADQSLATARVSAMIRNDPQGFLDSIRGPSGSSDKVINDTIDRYEGSSYVPSDGNSGAPAKFGINQRANPDVDVANLTRDSAVQLYKDRYWKPIGADHMPPALAAAAFDTAVNMGVPTARQLLSQSGGDPQKLLDLRRERYRQIAAKDPAQAQYLQGWLNRVDQVQQNLPGVSSGDRAFQVLPLGEQISFLRRADSAVQRQHAQSRADLSSRVQDAAAMAQNGVTDPNPIPLEDFSRAFGSEDGITQYGKYAATQDLARDVASVRGAPVSDVMGLLAANQPRPGPGYADDEHRNRIFQQAVATDFKARNDDPAQYAASTSPDARAASTDMQSTATNGDMKGLQAATKRYANAVLVEQDRLGLPHQLLTQPEAERISAQFLDTSGGGKNPAALMVALQDQWGPHFNDIYAQLAKHGKLPAAALVIPNMSDQGSQERLARWDNPESIAGFKKALPTTGSRDLDTAIQRQAAPFLATLYPQNGGEKTYSDVVHAAHVLGLGYMANGASAEDAAAQAFNEVAGHQYQMAGTYRIPINEQPNLVMAGVRQMRWHAQDIPYRAFPDMDHLTPEQVNTSMKDLVENKLVVVTDGDERGVDLYVDSGSGIRPLYGKDGKQINYSWATLRALGQSAEGDAFIGHPHLGRRIR